MIDNPLFVIVELGQITDAIQIYTAGIKNPITELIFLLAAFLLHLLQYIQSNTGLVIFFYLHLFNIIKYKTYIVFVIQHKKR